jgi:hypothetical protein
MKLLEDNVAMEGPLDGPNLERILLCASQIEEANSAPSSWAAPMICMTSPLQIDRVTEVFGLFFY